LGDVKEIREDFKTPDKDKDTNKNIIVKNVKSYECLDRECGHTWIPNNQEERIYATIRRRTRNSLTPKEIKTIREALPFVTKSEVAGFLNLNTKAFIKWEKGYTAPNDAYDLLLRLVVYSKDNLEFIQTLHDKNFAFDVSDYELLSGRIDANVKEDIPSIKTSISTVNGFPAVNDISKKDQDYHEHKKEDHFGEQTKELELAA